MDAPFRIRSAALADAAALVAIERRCFGDPWSETSFREALASDWTFGLVAETSGCSTTRRTSTTRSTAPPSGSGATWSADTFSTPAVPGPVCPSSWT